MQQMTFFEAGDVVATPALNPAEAKPCTRQAVPAVPSRDVLDDLPTFRDSGGTWRGLFCEFDMYYVSEPEAEWHFMLDDFGVQFTDVRYPLVFFRQGENPSDSDGVYRREHIEPGPGASPVTTLRVAPDTEYQSWRNQYVTLTEEWSHGQVRLSGYFRCTIRRWQGGCGIVGDVAHINFEILAGRWDDVEFNSGQCRLDQLPTWMEAEVRRKLVKLQVWYADQRERRAQGLPLLQAHAEWEKCKAQEQEAKRTAKAKSAAAPVLPPAAPDAAATTWCPETVRTNPRVVIDDDLLQQAIRTSSPDTISDCQKIRGVFTWNDRMWVCISHMTNRCESVRVVLPAAYGGVTHRGERYSAGGYEGLTVTFRRKEYVLAASERLVVLTAEYAEAHPEEVS